MINWFIENWIEIVAVVTGLAYIFLSIKQKISCWVFGIISSGLYLFIFFSSKIYADMALQAYYVVMGVYGWIHWARIDDLTDKTELKVLRLSNREILILLGVTIILFIGIAQFLIFFTDSTIPWIDAFTTSLSFTATWMLTRKILEHWLIWIVVNSVSIGLYFYRELYVTIILFVIFTIMAIVGYFEWKRDWEQNSLQKLTK